MRAFAVSEVEEGTTKFGKTSLAQSLRERVGEIEAGASNTGGLIASDDNGLLEAVHLAFSDHLPLVLSPDDIWLCIAQGFGIHVTTNAEALRRRFVSHTGKLTLEVRRPEFVPGSPDNDWSGVFAEFSDQIATHVGKTRDLLVSDFTTTGPIERAATQVVLMSAMQEYFVYKTSFCGIPRITLTGTPEDWRNIRRRAAVLAEYDLKEWVASLLPVLDQFIEASQGIVDRAFWRSIYKTNDESGGPFVTGWLNVLFPYLHGRQLYVPNSHALNWSRRAKSRLGPSTNSFPTGLSRAPIQIETPTAKHQTAFLSGFVGVSQDAATLELRPAIGWAVANCGTPSS